MANELYENIPELGAQEQAILRRRRIAEAMIARGQQPLETSQMVGNVVAPVSWTQGLAQLANAYLGGKQAREADKEYGGLADKRRQMVADEMAKITALQNGQAGIEGIQAQPARTIQAPAPMQEGQVAPNFNTVPEQIPAVQGRAAVPAVAQDKRGAIMQALMSNLPEMQRYGTTMQANEVRDQNQAFKTQEAQSTRTDRAEQKQLDRENKIEILKEQIRSREMMGQQSNDLKEAMANLMSDTRLENTRLAASLRPSQQEPAPIVQTDAEGNVTLLDRTGNVIRQAGKIGKPSAQFEKAQVAKGKMSKDLSGVIPMLETISKDGGLIDQSTGSGAGALIDTGANFFGSATKGAIAVGKLKPMIDPILKLVPRFEGPQSDKDTASYKEAAGDLANPNTPNATKKAAAKSILQIYKKRQGQFTTSDYDSETGGGAMSIEDRLNKYK